jgi:hypothetical protein
MIAEVLGFRILCMSFMQVSEPHHKLLWRKKASRPPKGYLKFPLKALHWQFLESRLHDLLQIEALLGIAIEE